MKILNIGLLILSIFSPFVQSNAMTLVNEMSQNLQYVIMPTADDDEYFQKFDKLCKCVSEEVEKQLSNDQLRDFNTQLNLFAEQTESAAKDMALLLKNGPPKPSSELMSYLQLIEEPIVACEKRFNIRVEF
ncbi:hypothetical protein KW463_08550 [Vibrio fluvialis]|nr:hypothetical protein [Vibrio fluvialis]